MNRLYAQVLHCITISVRNKICLKKDGICVRIMRYIIGSTINGEVLCVSLDSNDCMMSKPDAISDIGILT